MITNDTQTDLAYGPDDTPPIPICLLLASQHLALILVFCIFVTVYVAQGGGGRQAAGHLITATLLFCGIGTLVQSFKKGPVGGGHMLTHVAAACYLPISIFAYKHGGAGLVQAMTVISGLVVAFLGRLLNRLRFMFPAEVSGVVVITLGITLVKPSIIEITEYQLAGRHVDPDSLLVGLATILPMVAFTIWGGKKLKLFTFLAGLAGGLGTAFLLGHFEPGCNALLARTPWLGLPGIIIPTPKFDWEFLIPFIMTAVAASLFYISIFVTSQRNNDPDWKCPDMENVSRAMMAPAISTMGSGLLGSLGTTPAASSLALNMATSSASRRIAWYVAGFALVLVFVPKVPVLVAAIPSACAGGILLYTAALMISTGGSLISSRMLDSRRTLMIGFSITAGMAVELTPWLFFGLPSWLAKITSSALTVASLSAIILNLIFRLGTAKVVTFEFAPESRDYAGIYDNMEKWGGAWGARRDVVTKATQALVEALQCLARPGICPEKVRVKIRYDEFSLDLELKYQGKTLNITHDVPPPGQLDEIIDDQWALHRLSCGLIGLLADRATCCAKSGGIKVLRIHFEH